MKKQTFLTTHLRLCLLKICALILFSGIFNAPLSAQEIPYTPFPKGNIAWQIWENDGCPYCWPIVLHIDTAQLSMDNKIYNKVFFDKSEISEQINVGGIREENKKIYLCVPELGEHIIYDFELAIGDTLFSTLYAYIGGGVWGGVFYADFHKSSEGTPGLFHVVKNKGIKTLKNGESRNTIILDKYISYGWGEDFEFWGTCEWVEGLGTLKGGGGFLATINVASYIKTDFDLGCICHNSTLLYSNANYICSLCGGSRINENLQQQITLYPNPTTGELRIENGELKIENVEIFDLFGKTVFSNHFINSSSHQRVNISHLPTSAYILKIITEDGVFTEKIIKQ